MYAYIYFENRIGVSIDELEGALPAGAWPNYVFGNHDETRLASRFGPEAARVLAMLLLSLRGTPTIYYGDELGFLEAEIPFEDQQDPWGINVPGLGRDGCRTPMQWDASPLAGFSSEAAARPWLPLTPDWAERNVENQLAEPSSMLNLHRALLEYRNQSVPLQSGDYRAFDAPDGCYLFARSDAQQQVLVALNFTDHDLEVPISGPGIFALSTDLVRAAQAVEGTIMLRGNEGIIIEMA